MKWANRWSLTFYLWHKNKSPYPYHSLRRDCRHEIRSHYMDYGKRGKGNKAWRRWEAILNDVTKFVI